MLIVSHTNRIGMIWEDPRPTELVFSYHNNTSCCFLSSNSHRPPLFLTLLPLLFFLLSLAEPIVSFLFCHAQRRDTEFSLIVHRDHNTPYRVSISSFDQPPSTHWLARNTSGLFRFSFRVLYNGRKRRAKLSGR